MKIKRCPIVFNNIISTKVKCKSIEWHITAIELRNTVIRNGLFATGPVIYQMSKENAEEEREYTFYLPINAPIRMADNDKYSFYETWKFEDGLVLRHADLSEDIEESYAILRAYAEVANLDLNEPFYNIFLDVYGESIIDIYAPIVKEI
jgi:effector-binding domain-containing protein